MRSGAQRALDRLRSQRALLIGLVACIAVCGAVRVVGTYDVFSQTWDEPAHIAAGMQWLSEGRYDYEYLHPPLARVATAVGLYVSGERTLGNHDIWTEGNQLLGSRGSYQHNLAIARLGILPFYFLAIIATWMWGEEFFGIGVATLASVLVATLPPILGHSGLATTDVPLAATLTLGLFYLVRWIETPRLRTAIFLGLATGVAVLSKFTAIPYFAASAFLLVGARLLFGAKPGRSIPLASIHSVAGQIFLSATAAALVVWTGYRYSVGPLVSSGTTTVGQWLTAHPTLNERAHGFLALPVPAPEFFHGVAEVLGANAAGRLSITFGQVRNGGVWYFFPLALAVKTPLGFLLLALLGIGVLGRRFLNTRDWRLIAPFIVIVAILATVIPSNMNLGVRHVLPIYLMLALLSAIGVSALWSAKRYRAPARAIAVALLIWHVASFNYASPDFLSYFNELAVAHPEEVEISSDLDWGQDLGRLSDTLSQRNVQSVSIAYFGSANLNQFPLPSYEILQPSHPKSGWVAISLQRLFGSTGYGWLRAYRPVTRVGNSIWLYYIPPALGVRQ